MNKNTSELTSRALDWAVAKALGLNPNTDVKIRRQYVGYEGFAEANGFGFPIKNYSIDWSQGGPIIDQEHISPHWVVPTNHINGGWSAHIPGGNGRLLYGPTPLIAAMRCFVASKLGDEVSIPDELV